MTRLLLIAGWGRSGSTILANVLGSAPGVETLGEINNIWERGFRHDLLCSCGEAFSACPLWAPLARSIGPDNTAIADRVQQSVAGLGNTWLIKRRLPLIGRRYDGDGAAYGELLSTLYEAAAAHTGAQLLVDASKSPWHCAIAASLSGFDTTILHLIRDPRGVAHSLLKKVDYQNGGRQIDMDRHSPTASSMAWVYRNRLVESEWGSNPAYVQILYEDFIANPQDRTAELFTRVGLPDLEVPFLGPAEVDIAPTHNISGNPVRFRRGSVTLRTDDEWKDKLPNKTQRYIRLITWPHMGHYGYR